MEEMKLRVHEIFSSIQGEGVYTGYPTTFIRLSGCNLRCSYCDTKDSWDNTAPELDLRQLKLDLTKYDRNDYYCITGGEPLLQKEQVISLANWLVKRGKHVNIETNGSISISEEDGLDDRVVITMDVKCPSSNMFSEQMITNICMLGSQDEVKFVVGTEKDLDFVEAILKEHKILASTIISIVAEEPDILKRVLYKLNNVSCFRKTRLGLQLHKVIGVV